MWESQAWPYTHPCLAEDKSDKETLRPAKSMDSLSAAAGASDGECRVHSGVCACACTVVLTTWACEPHLCLSVRESQYYEQDHCVCICVCVHVANYTH